jgi:hypothetical protein
VQATLICGDASQWVGGGVDLVLTNPYAPLPACLLGVPALVTNFAERREKTEGFVGAALAEVGIWARGGRNIVWAANMPAKLVELSDLVEEEFMPGRGWFPLDLPRRLLDAFGKPGMTIWDGFMGRGTVGKACLERGMSFIGIDRDPERVELARKYINI